MFAFQACLLTFKFIFMTAFRLGLCLPQFRGRDKKSPRTFCLCVIDMKNGGLLLKEAPDNSLVIKEGEDLGEQLFLASLLLRPGTIFHLLYSCHKSTVNIKFQKKKNLSQKTAVFNIQPVYSGELLDVEKFSFLFVFILDSCLVKSAFCK